MRFYNCLSLASCLWCIPVQGQNAFIDTHNLTEVISTSPACAQTCLLPILPTLPCNITSTGLLASCICANVTVQAHVSACVMKQCDLSDQSLIATTNHALCQGFHIEEGSRHLLATVAIVGSITFPFIILRVWSRLSYTSLGLGRDDAAMLVAATCLIAIMGAAIKMSLEGWGNHTWTIEATKVSMILKLYYSIQVLYVFCQWFTKLSILLFYLRIFPQEWFIKSTKATVVLASTSAIIFVFLAAFQCSPVAFYWNRSINGKCLNQLAIVYAGTGSSIIFHLVILVLPIPCISTLRVGRGKRIGLFVMFGLGTFALVASAVRARYLGSFGTSSDPSWDNGVVELWSAIEISVGLVCVCLPALRPLLVRYLPRFFSSHSERKHSYRPFLSRYTPKRFRRDHSSIQMAQVPESPRQARVWHKKHELGDTRDTQSTQATQTTWDTQDSGVGGKIQAPSDKDLGERLVVDVEEQRVKV